MLLQTKELLYTVNIGKLLQQWDTPFTVMAYPAPNAYTMALPLQKVCSSNVNADSPKPSIFFCKLDGATLAPRVGRGTGAQGALGAEKLQY